jgi:hypothetical protein
MIFEEAYEDLKASSELLVKTKDDLVEVYETGGVLLTVIDFQEKAIGTKRLNGDRAHYEQLKAELMEVY